MKQKSTVVFRNAAEVVFEWEDFDENSQFEAAISALKRYGYLRGLTRSAKAYWFNAETYQLEYKDGRVLGEFEIY